MVRAGKSLTRALMVAVEAALQERFGAHAGWAHTLLFISELASQRHRLPLHLQPGSRARPPAVAAAKAPLVEQAAAAAGISVGPAAASAPAGGRRKRRAAEQLASAEALWCQAEDAAGVGGLVARSTLESTAGTGAALSADTANDSVVAVATTGNGASCCVAVSITAVQGHADSVDDARELPRKGMKAWRRRKAGSQAGLLASPCSSVILEGG